MKIKKKEVTGMKYLSLALLSFLTLGIELLYAFLLEPILYGHTVASFTTPQFIIHWIITCTTWGICAWLILKYASNKYNFHIYECRNPIKTWQWLLAIACTLFLFAKSYIAWDGFKVLVELKYNGLLKFIFQYIYYLFETFLFMLIIVFGQHAFEILFHKKNIPYGAFIVALTWGLSHWLTKGSLFSGFYAAFGGFCFGVVYLLLNRNIKWTFVFLYFMFIL